MHTLGTINEIWRYPFKSMGGERLKSCTVTPNGVQGDRGWAVRDVETGKLGSAKRLPTLLLCTARYLDEPNDDTIPHAAITFPDGSTTQTDHNDASDRLSAYLGRAVTLESSIGKHFDDSPISMQTSASMATLQQQLPESEINHARFRHNFSIQSPSDSTGYAEIQWLGKTIAVGEVHMTLVKPVRRCPMVSAAQPDIAEDKRVLQTILDHADRRLGVYATTERTGVIHVGNPVNMH